MKKVLIACFISMVAFTASAASLLWSSDLITFGATALKNNANVTGYVVYLGSGGSLQPSYTLDGLFTPTTIGSVATTDSDGTPKSGKVTGTFTFDFGTYVNGDVFSLLLVYNDTASGKTYYNLSSTLNTMAGIVDEISTPTDWTSFAVNSTVVGQSGTIAGGGGWVTPVPEPATAALALAGLALLIRRRK